MDYDGFLNINKPSGWTSHDVVAKIRKVLKGLKVGHTGTLDPLATGVLPLCLGKATKIAQYLVDMEKEYCTVMRLGEVTDTQDATGKVLQSHSVEGIDEERIQRVVEHFIGPLRQTPPMYSAIKIGGSPLYKRARRGEVIPRQAREVTIFSLTLLGVTGRDVSLHVVCSKGTYIRSLCADIGEQLGVGAHLAHLERRRSGPFRIEDSLSMDQFLDAVAGEHLDEEIYSMDEVLARLPVLTVTETVATRVRHGVPLSLKEVLTVPHAFRREERMRVHTNGGDLIALASAIRGSGETSSDPVFRIEKVLVGEHH